MMSVPQPVNEIDRLDVLRQYHILDTPAEEVFDSLTRLASYICGAPVALVTLIDAHRQWIKSKVGLDVEETSRDVAFCAHTILQSEVMVVPDALEDDRFADNPFVVSDPNIRFYAGTPLLTPEGHALGSLCVIDYVPRDLSPEQLDALRILGEQVVSQLDLRRNVALLASSIKEREQAEAALRQVAQENSLLAAAINSANIGISISDPALPDNPLIFVNPAFSKITGYTSEEAVGRNCRYLQGPDSDPQVVAAIRQAMVEKEPCTVILRNYRKDGTPFFNELTISPVFNDKNEVINYIGLQNDVTERQVAQVEQARLLAEVEAAYRQYVRQQWDQLLTDEHGGKLRVEYQKPSFVPNGTTEQADDYQTESANLVVPVKLRGETLGTLRLQADTPERQWTAEETALVETVSEQLAQTIENLRLFEETQQRATREQLTRQITDKMRAAPDIETIIQTGLSELTQALGVPRTYVKLVSAADTDEAST